MRKVFERGLLLGIGFCGLVQQVSAQQKKTKSKFTNLVWADEFNNNGLPDPAKWSYEEGFVRGIDNQIYTKGRIQNAAVGNGFLTITGKKEQYANKQYSVQKKMAYDVDNARKALKTEQLNKPAAVRKFYDSVSHYTSASITTLGKAEWTYGRIEVKAKVPSGKGVWPAIWMLGTNRAKTGWPKCGEIDIMEFVGKDPGHVFATVHYADTVARKTKQKQGSKIDVNAPFNDFHIYAVEWDSTQIKFYYDEKAYYTFSVDEAGTKADNPFRKPFYLLLNLALGGEWGGPIDDSILPGKFVIDYVRVYQ